MKHHQRHFGFLTASMIFILLVGYLSLALVIVFSEEINAVLAEPKTAEVAVESLAPSFVIEPPPPNPAALQPVLNHSINLAPTERPLPGQAYLEGKTTKFLMGF